MEEIEQLILDNIKMWHLCTKIKKDGKPLHSLTTEERVDIFYKIRHINSDRSKHRYLIDKKLGIRCTNENKIRYSKE